MYVKASHRMGDQNFGPTTNAAVGPGCICSRLYPVQFQGGLTSGRRPIVKTIAESLSKHDENNAVPTPLSGISVGKN
jgi:hypothetical protein